MQDQPYKGHTVEMGQVHINIHKSISNQENRGCSRSLDTKEDGLAPSSSNTVRLLLILIRIKAQQGLVCTSSDSPHVFAFERLHGSMHFHQLA